MTPPLEGSPKRQPVSPKTAVPVMPLVTTARQLAILVKAGIPLAQSVKIIGVQTEHAPLQAVLEAVQRDIERGSSFSESLRRFPNVFSEPFVNSVAAGEVGGVLDLVLTRLADVMERDYEITMQIKGALRYPILVTGAILSAVIFLMVFVVPRFASIYARFQTELPLPTKVLIGASHFLFHGWMFYVPAGVGLFLFVRWALARPWGRAGWDRWKLRLPIFGGLFLKIAMTRFASMLTFLYTSGLPILKALEVTSRAVGNLVIQREIGQLERSVSEGKGLSGGLERASFFPPMVRHMIAVGETSGKLGEILGYVVEYYEREVRNLTRGLNTLIEPLLTFALGIVVLGLALAIFLPLWSMSQLFRH